jgi:hypothetical protein
MGDGVFRGIRTKELSQRRMALLISQFSVVEKDLEVDLWRRKVRIEDFIDG